MNRFAERYGLPQFEERPVPVTHRLVDSRSWDSFVEAIFALYPQAEFQALIAELNAAGGEFAELFARIDALRPVFQAVQESPIALQIGADLRALGVDVDRVIEAIKNTWGWQ